jgi:hypothetical protein
MNASISELRASAHWLRETLEERRPPAIEKRTARSWSSR